MKEEKYNSNIWNKASYHKIKTVHEENYFGEYHREQSTKAFDYFKDFLKEGKSLFKNILKILEEISVNLESKNFVFLLNDDATTGTFFDYSFRTYELREINGKPVLADEDFNLYEAVEYYDVDFLNRNSVFWGDKNPGTLHIEKVVKIKKIN